MTINRCFEFGNRVWVDENKNGIQDPTEKGLNGVKVLLFDESDNPVLLDDGTQKNDVTSNKDNFQLEIPDGYAKEDGIYRLKFLAPGKYRVQFILPEGYEFSPKNIGSDVDTDSDADEGTGFSDLIEMTVEEPWFYRIDAGVYKKVTTDEPDKEPVLPITGENQEMIQLALGILFIGCILITSVFAKNKSKNTR